MKKKDHNIASPELIWSIEDEEEDLKNLERLDTCKLDISGLYFRR